MEGSAYGLSCNACGVGVLLALRQPCKFDAEMLTKRSGFEAREPDN